MTAARAPATNGDYGRLERGLYLVTGPRIQTREDIQRYSRYLIDKFAIGPPSPVLLGGRLNRRPMLHESIAARLSQFLDIPRSEVLCLQMPQPPVSTDQGMRIASHTASTARDMDYHVVSHFCSLSRGEIAEGRSMRTVAFCELAASLLQQMIALLPETLPESAPSFDEARFTNLDSTLRTWDRMLALFADIISIMPWNTTLVIHGLQCFNNNNNAATGALQELLDVIRGWIDDKRDPLLRRIKVLFVTEGQARAVVPWLQPHEYMMYEGSRQFGY